MAVFARKFPRKISKDVLISASSMFPALRGFSGSEDRASSEGLEVQLSNHRFALFCFVISALPSHPEHFCSKIFPEAH